MAISAPLASQESDSEKPIPDPFADLKAVQKELWMLAPASDEKLQQVAKELGADEFTTRQNARQRLLHAPKSWAPLLKELHGMVDDPEVRESLAHVLENMKPENRTTSAQLARSTLMYGHRGLGADFLAALPAALNRRSAEYAIAAARLSVTDDEKAEVIKSLSSDNALVREGAVRVVAALIIDPRDTLKDCLDDADGLVRLATAEIFAARADPTCLGVLAGMLGSEDFYLRWRAAGMLRSMTGGAIDTDPMKAVDVAGLNLDKWRKPSALTAWQANQPLPLISLFQENEDLSSWTLARGALADVPELNRRDGHLTSRGTGQAVWASPWRFQNYRVRLEWRFGWRDREMNSGFSLGKFDTPSPEHFEDWMRNGALEIEIKEGTTGAMYRSGTTMLVKGKKPGHDIKTHHRHNERGTDWNTLEVEELDGTLRIWVNGLLQNEATELSDTMTTFGLRSDRSSIDWRNLMLEPLPGARIAPPLEEIEEVLENGDDEQGDD